MEIELEIFKLYVITLSAGVGNLKKHEALNYNILKGLSVWKNIKRNKITSNAFWEKITVMMVIQFLRHICSLLEVRIEVFVVGLGVQECQSSFYWTGRRKKKATKFFVLAYVFYFSLISHKGRIMLVFFLFWLFDTLCILQIALMMCIVLLYRCKNMTLFLNKNKYQ